MAVAKTIQKPMTCSEIWDLARRDASRIQLNDVSSIVKEMQKRGLLVCLTPDEPKGKIFGVSELGRAVLSSAFNHAVSSIPDTRDWKIYGKLIRAPRRKEVFLEIGRAGLGFQDGKSASKIRKRLKEKFPIGLGSVSRSIKELEEMELIEKVESQKSKVIHQYVATEAGRRMHEKLVRRDLNGFS